jgi:DNA-binding response OmpR family regulator
MEHPVRSDVRVALCETHPALRSGFQTALYRRGMRDMEVCKDSASLLTLLNSQIVDLVVCATDLPGLDFCDMMQQIRHGTIGRNPFTLVLATVGEATIDDIRRVVNAGVDRVVRKPMSMGDMVACVNALAASRKPFTATESYVGPSRRATGRGERDVNEVMEVPNTLCAKLGGDVQEGHLVTLIDKGMVSLARLRAHNSCVAISRSVQRIAQHFQRNGQGRITNELQRLMSLSEAIDRRYRGTANAHLSEVAVSLGLLVEVLTSLPPESSRNLAVTVELLQKLGEVIRLVDENNPQVIHTVQSIAQTVRSFANGMVGGGSGVSMGNRIRAAAFS